MDFRIFLEYKLFRTGNHCSKHIVVDSMAGFRYNFQHMSILDGLVSIDKLRMVHMVMVNMDFPVVVFQCQLPESNDTIQMDFQFHLGYSYKLDCD